MCTFEFKSPKTRKVHLHNYVLQGLKSYVNFLVSIGISQTLGPKEFNNSYVIPAVWHSCSMKLSEIGLPVCASFESFVASHMS